MFPSLLGNGAILLVFKYFIKSLYHYTNVVSKK